MKQRTENSITFEDDLVNPLLSLMSTEIVCSVCRNKSIKLDCIFDVSVNVTRSIDESLNRLHNPEAIEDFLCIKCSTEASVQLLKHSQGAPMAKRVLGKYLNSRALLEEADLVRKVKNRAVISNKIVKFPKLLCIHCKWLVPHPSGYMQKRNEHMKFSMILHIEKGAYLLKAIIEHLGGSSGGHFLTYKVVAGVWYQCSDLTVREVTQLEVLSAQPYMLFYQLEDTQ